MGIQIGDINIAEQTLTNEFRLAVVERILESLLNNNSTLHKPSQAEINNIRKEVLEQLKVKYPNSGIELKNK